MTATFLNPATSFLTVALFAMALTSAHPATGQDLMTPLRLNQVEVGGEIGRRISVTVTNNLLALHADRDFLLPFREKKKSSGYIGLGKLIDATVRLAVYTGDPRVMALKDHLIEETIRVQEADGYIGMLAESERMGGLWDVHEMGYIIWGLLAEADYFENPSALRAARRAADYIVARWSSIPADWGQKTGVAPHVAVTGIERAMLALYRQTEDRAFLDFCVTTRELPEWDLGIVVGRRPGIEGHVYAYMARCLAQLELYREQPEPGLLRSTRRALDFILRGNGALITGATGQCEIWTHDQDGREDIGETCATAYQLRVYDSWLRLKGDATLGDLMERTIYNALFAAQSPDGRRLRYFAPMEGERVYWEGDTYCCPCNYRRIVAELPAMVFYRSGGGVAINLYTAAQAEFQLRPDVSLSLRQRTDYPSSGKVVVSVDPSRPLTFPLRLRIPGWCRGAKVAVNERAWEGDILRGQFLTLEREWKAGDRVTLELPMPWRFVKGRERQAGRVAVMRGPQVFCLNPARQEQLAALDGAELGYLTLDPGSIQEPVSESAVRPGDRSVRLQAWKPGFGLSLEGDYELTLTEFPDPAGRATYFRLREYSVAVEDELLGGQNGP